MRNLVTEEHIPTETTQCSLQSNALGYDILTKVKNYSTDYLV